MNRFFSNKVTHQFALSLSKRSHSTVRTISTKLGSTIYLGGAAALVSAIAWTSIYKIDNEVDKKKIEEGKSIAEHTGSSQKVDEAKKQAVGRGKVSTKVPPQENEPETKSEIESDQEAEQTKTSLAGSKNEKLQKGSNDSEVKWDNKILKPISSGACGGQFKDVFSALLSSSDLKGSDTIKKLEALRRCLKEHSEILKD
ncbi:uncharacterized protein AC631_05527 [Debaryomyces fabryi]|uniref:Uncharacterized protein n=1 Tax=Debaryomyces fabryi TaxID=58627 RepID=A0A0V1PR48_9ASCO|nr:uncharacterized protein AC631_05527 [Debaryomyces fabryi]KRZ98710.1 hypothetical protein AC631_05527 [Debaryomyces fabryi]CUM57043.1 unnamed protein product [Debaryomyces fabryi]